MSFITQYFERLDAAGRARFADLSTDTERLINTKYTSGMTSIFMAILLSILYMPVFCALFVYWVPPEYRGSVWWIYMIYASVWVGAIQGGAIGSILGWGMGLYWQGKRHKAGMFCLIGGAIALFLMGLFQALFYEGSAMPLAEFTYWAFLYFSPAYLAAAGVTVWGLGLLCTGE